MSAGTVLILDSNVDVLEIVKAMLARSSYDVLTAESIPVAWGILHTRPIDLVMAEAVLPGGSGAEFIRKVKQEFPSTAVMLMTAFSDEPLDPGIPVIEKPFSFSDLAELVRRVLAHSPDTGPSFHQIRWGGSLFEGGAGIFEPADRNRQAGAGRGPGERQRPATILVAEADPNRRSELKRLLSLHGYSVLDAPDVAQALAFVLGESARIDVIVVNALMHTEELMRHVRAERPGIPIIFTTLDGTAEHVLSMVEQMLRASGSG